MKKFNRVFLTALASVGVTLAVLAAELILALSGIWNPAWQTTVGICLIGGWYTGKAVWQKPYRSDTAGDPRTMNRKVSAAVGATLAAVVVFEIAQLVCLVLIPLHVWHPTNGLIILVSAACAWFAGRALYKRWSLPQLACRSGPRMRVVRRVVSALLCVCAAGGTLRLINGASAHDWDWTTGAVTGVALYGFLAWLAWPKNVVREQPEIARKDAEAASAEPC